jgi:hypothetical protein
MRPTIRKAILFTILLGIVGYLVLDPGDDARERRGAQPRATSDDATKVADASGRRDSAAETGAGRYALPERAALGKPHAQLFGPQSWQPKAAPRAAVAAAPRVPPMPYRYAGKVLHEGQMKVFLARGDEVIAVRKGDTLKGAYRVEAIENTRITLRYLPLGRMQIIPVDSALPLASAPAGPAHAPHSGTGTRAPTAVAEGAARARRVARAER